MTTTDQNFAIYQGETKQITVPVLDSNGDPQSLTGATVVWIAQNYANDTTNLLTKSPDVVNVNDTNDGVQWTLTPANTKDLAARSYWHECRVTISGNETVIFTGTMTVKESGTKPA